VPARKLAIIPYHTTLWGAKYPEHEGEYVFAGGDTNRDYRTLIQAVTGLTYKVVIAVFRRDHFAGVEIPPNVEILTASRDEFFRLMARSAVVVVPMQGGLIHSGGHQTYLNAMELGKPVVVADDGGADEYIADGVTGFIVKPGELAGLRKALQTLMCDRAMARRLGQNAKAAAEEYTPEKWFERIFALARECSGEKDNG
jgi:glycosyltransferase involved in cell wall biosynthesis